MMDETRNETRDETREVTTDHQRKCQANERKGSSPFYSLTKTTCITKKTGRSSVGKEEVVVILRKVVL